VSLMRIAGNTLNQSLCCSLASFAIQLTRLSSLKLDYDPVSCIDSGDWQRLGWPVPPQDMRRTWTQALSYARLFPACCTLVCSSRSHLAAAIRVAAAGPPLLLYAAPTAVPVYMPRLTHAQLQLLMCVAGHACHFVRVMMPRDVRHHTDPRKQLLLRLFADAVAQRLLRLGLQRE